jgi:hypothetical protein
MNAKERKWLSKMAKLMLAEARSSGNERIFSATGFARENISILHQQVRCANLAWALRYTKTIRRGDVVAVVGGSFSGLMLACSLAIADDIIVYIFEKDKRLLNRFLDKSHRYLSPNLNSRYLGVRFDPADSAPFYNPSIFSWKSAAASEVAHQWLENFERYCRMLPIFTFLEWEVRPEDIQQCDQRIRIKLRPHLQPVEVDLLIDATGFGDEANPRRVADYSYWEAGHRLIYDHLPRDCTVLVSGCGDSGIIEALHYTIKDFRHEFVENLWPHVNLEAHLDIGLASAKLDQILLSEEIDRYDGQVISELCWWLDTWYRLDSWIGNGWSLRKEGPHARPVFQAIEDAIQPHLPKAFPGRNLKRLAWHEREAFLLALDMGSQLAIRAAVIPLVEHWISLNIERLVRKLPPGTLPKLGQLHENRRPGVVVTLNGMTPTLYTRQLSSYNVWLARILTTFPNVHYRQGRITNVVEDAGSFKVTYADSAPETYDRVVTRYGPTPSSDRTLATRNQPDPHRGNWLLNRVHYTIPSKDPQRGRMVEPGTYDVEQKLPEVLQRRGSGRVHSVNKTLYRSLLLSGPTSFKTGLYGEGDPQTWLSSKLRSGLRPSYEEGFNLARNRRRRKNDNVLRAGGATSNQDSRS